MNLLIDTHALLWWLEDNPRLSAAARSVLSDTDSIVFVSAASVWEIAIKQNQGRLNAPRDILDLIASFRWLHLPISLRHGIVAGSLPRHHSDPFDRMLVAQAQSERLTIITRDPRIEQYDVPTLQA